MQLSKKEKKEKKEKMEKKAAIFTATGCEEIEALTVVDLLRRAGIQIDIVSISKEMQVMGSHNIVFGADKKLEDLISEEEQYDAYIIPGGMPGTKNLATCSPLCDLLVKSAENGKLVAAICAAPSVLGTLGLLNGKKACCYPGFEDKLLGAKVSYNPVETDGDIITSRGLGTAIEFAAAIIAKLLDKEAADKVLSAIVYK